MGSINLKEHLVQGYTINKSRLEQYFSLAKKLLFMNKEIEIYTGKDGQTQIEVQFKNETFWLSLNQIAELFERDKSVVSRHLSNIFKEGELDKNSTVAKNATVQIEAGREIIRKIEYYNLDAILSVGYRVNSKQGTQFRIWATQRLKEHLVQGYTINKKRLEQLQQTVELIQKVAPLSLRPPKPRGRSHITRVERLDAIPHFRSE